MIFPISETMKPSSLFRFLLTALALVLAASCAPAMPATSPVATQAVAGQPEPGASAAPSVVPPTAAAEPRTVELEWPDTLRLGDSDVIRLTLLPSGDTYIARTEFPDHSIAQQEVPIQRLPGYELLAVARLEGVRFDLSPPGDQERPLPPGQQVTWYWSVSPKQAGRHRLALSLWLRQVDPTGAQPLHETPVFSRGLEVQVSSVLGLTGGQAGRVGLIVLLLGLLFGATLLIRPVLRARLQVVQPNPRVTVEPFLGLQLSPEHARLLRALFRRYARLIVTMEFRSGYSGARTFLLQPVLPDGRSDAYTIAKVGQRRVIRREFDNYESFVKDTLPPVTARIQHAPVTLRGSRLAALRYTFIGSPGETPLSLRQALLANLDPAPLRQLFAVFGPHWWRQRRPYTFRINQEYDGIFPSHAVLEPALGAGPLVAGRTPLAMLAFHPGDLVRLGRFTRVEPRADGQSWSLTGNAQPGQPALRLTWLGPRPPRPGETGRVVATRGTTLAGLVSGFDRFGLPDPLAHLPEALAQTLNGTQSTIHGDLNLENILVGPGGLLWLIDFAQTRPGHPLADFAHLRAEIIAHVLAEQVASPQDYLNGLRCEAYPLLTELDALACQYLFDPTKPGEYDLAVYLSCLGALKHANLSAKARYLLYLSAADIVTRAFG